MGDMSNADSLRRANKCQYSMAKKFLVKARATTSQVERTEYVKFVNACRRLIARNRAAQVAS
jgi:hypothetical protein